MGVLVLASEYGLLLISAAVVVYLVKAFQVYVRLRHFDGPFWAGISDWPHSRAMMNNTSHDWYADITEKYGLIAKVAPNTLLTSSPDIWAHVNNKPGYKRTDWFFQAMRIEHLRDSVFTQTDNNAHERRRRQLAPGYAGTDTMGIEVTINECLKELIHLIRSKYISSDAEIIPMDIARKLQFFLLDTITALNFGESVGSVKQDNDVEDYIKSTEEGLITTNAALALGVSWLSQMPLIGQFFLPWPNDGTGFGKLMAECFSYADKHTKNPTDKPSNMLASFIRNGVMGDELRSETVNAISIGSFPPLAAITGILLHVFTNRRVASILQQEIDAAVREGKAPPVSDGLITSAQVKQLPYLQATIREGLRFEPPVVGFFPRDVPPGGDTVLVNGKPTFLPGGVSIGRSVSGMYRSKEIYGKDANSFRPERWFEPDLAKLAEMTRTNEMLFNYGKAQCLGKAIAHMEIGKTLFELLRNFDFAIINPTHPWKTVNTLGVFIISDMWVQVRDRTGLQ